MPHNLTCPTATTLEQFVVDCIVEYMPRRGEGYEIPDSKVQSDWRDVVRHMLNGSCDDIVLSASLYTNYSVSTFHDVDTGEDYSVLREDVDVDGDGRVDKGRGRVSSIRIQSESWALMLYTP